MSDCDKFIFITGGRRSGKSSYALELAESLGSQRLYLATAEALDDEMDKRIKRHREERGNGWDTAEEPVNVADVIEESAEYDVILIDCLTLWLCNVMHKGDLGDETIMKEIDSLVEACRESGKTLIAVSNELGSGVIPDNPLSRRFTDLAGMMNQKMAAAADRVVLTISGIPMTIKGNI